MFNFFNKKNKFSDYKVYTGKETKMMTVFPKKYEKEMDLDDCEVFSIEASFLIKNKYYSFSGFNIPKEVILYIKENAEDRMIFTSSGRLIGHEFDDDLALTKFEKK